MDRRARPLNELCEHTKPVDCPRAAKMFTVCVLLLPTSAQDSQLYRDGAFAVLAAPVHPATKIIKIINT